jgi:hypothetical protein
MIINEYMTITVNPNSVNYYNKIGYKCNNYEKIKIKTIELPKGSNIKIEIKCDNCASEISVVFNKYYKSTNSLSEDYLCRKCNHVKTKKTKLEKYGDENYHNIEKAKKTKLEKYGNENYNNIEKIKETNVKKYGVNNVSNSIIIKNKKKESYLKVYGVSNPFENIEIKNKIKKTCLSKYGSEYYITSNEAKKKYDFFCNKLGVTHYSKSIDFKNKFENTCVKKWGVKTNLLDFTNIEKVKSTNIIRYGFDNVMRNKDISLLNTMSLVSNRNVFFEKLGYEYIDYEHENFLYKLKSIKCSHIFEINYDLFRSRIKYDNNCCLVCYPKDENSSIKEKEIVNWLKEMDINVIENDRKLIKKEIDIYLPDFKIGIEFNGLYWHSDKFKEKNYHIDKTNKCLDIGIQLIHIWEDDWIYKKEIIKSIIRNRLNKITNKIYARKCEIKVVSSKESKIFLNENHIQGTTTSSIKIGLFYNSELVSLMTLGNRNTNSKSIFELIRFCNKLNYTIIGGANKLFNFFLKNYKYDKITSYSDISLFTGNLYKNLGFFNDGKTSLNYYWTDLNKKYHRFNFNKKKLISMGYDKNKTEEEIMKEIGYYKIWSCGQIRWILTN